MLEGQSFITGEISLDAFGGTLNLLVLWFKHRALSNSIYLFLFHGCHDPLDLKNKLFLIERLTLVENLGDDGLDQSKDLRVDTGILIISIIDDPDVLGIQNLEYLVALEIKDPGVGAFVLLFFYDGLFHPFL